MIYTSKTELPTKETTKEYYFLAGSIDFNEGNWRQQFMEETNLLFHIFDPTRAEHNYMNNSEMQEHINWELDALALSDKIILNFLPESKSPISLIELGMYVKSSKLIVVCPEAFYQKRYIKNLCKKYNTELFNSLEEAIKSIKENVN